jgi:hypothetical protein
LPQLTFEIPQDVFDTINKHIPNGFKRHAYEALLRGFAVELENNHEQFLLKLIESRRRAEAINISALVEKGFEHGGPSVSEKPAGSSEPGTAGARVGNAPAQALGPGGRKATEKGRSGAR